MPGEGERLVWTYVEALSREDDDTVSTVLSDDFELIEAPELPAAAHLRGAEALDRYEAMVVRVHRARRPIDPPARLRLRR
jgi:hypothetical protein